MKTGTLKELNVKPGDVVGWVDDKSLIWEAMPDGSLKGLTGGCLSSVYFAGGSEQHCNSFRIISRADDTPTLWRDMTPEEKGKLLLAHHEGKVIEYLFAPNDWQPVSPVSPRWRKTNAYRIKPQPKVETVTLYWQGVDGEYKEFDGMFDTHRITFNTIDGKPDAASIKMEEL